jgi:hypothetical protein
MTTPDLLTSFETCDRKGYWSQNWRQKRMEGVAMLREAIKAGVTSADREDFGELAGETVMDLGADPGIEMPSGHDVYQSIVHHAALADMLTTALRRPTDKPWLLTPAKDLCVAPWVSSAFLDPSGEKLRRVVLASSWNDARHYSEIRSWYGLGEVAIYGLPMTMAVLILGQHRDGRRSGPWTKGFLHPQNHKLRFRKRSKVTSEVFSDKWQQVWREDRGEITNREWLQAMLEDDVLRDVCFKVEIPVPGMETVKRVREMAMRKLNRLAKMRETPEASMSVCERPPCPFKGCCWSNVGYEPSEKTGYVKALPGILPGINNLPRRVGGVSC